MANSTVASLIGYGLQLAKVGTDTQIDGLSVTDALVRIVDRENRNFIEAPYQVNQAGWDFMIQELGWTVQSATTTTGALTQVSTVIPVTATDAFNYADKPTGLTGGAGVIYSNNVPDTFLFAASSTTTGAGNLTTVSGLSVSHASTTSIYTMYSLAANYGRPRAEKWRGDGLTIDTIPYFYGGTGQPNGYFFSVFYDPTANVSYIWLPRDLSGQALLRYDQAPAHLTLNTQTVDVPVAFEEYIVQKVAAHVMRVLSKDPNKIVDCEQQAMNVINMAFAKRSINKRVTLSRRPIRSPGHLASGHYLTANGEVY